jgi:hypothetical protein
VPESVGVVKRQRPAGRGPWTPWRDAGYGQAITLAAGPATSLRESEGEHGLVVLRGRHSGWGVGVVSSSRQPEMREDPVDDGGVVDRGEQFHPVGELYVSGHPPPTGIRRHNLATNEERRKETKEKAGILRKCGRTRGRSGGFTGVVGCPCRRRRDLRDT